ncbi:MAG: helix-turn-helix transcriptional regulator [Chitinophagaceae bacterium]|nr:helix-turn-helix transcriptional regulator [Chitinophagaceae bacterium]
MRSEIDQYVIDQIRIRRKKLKVSQEELAYALGFESKGYIGKIESKNPKYSDCYNIFHLNQIAKKLRCSPKDFWPEKPL